MGVSGVQRLVQFRGDRGRLNGDRRSNHIGMVRLDVIPSPSQIYVLPVQDWISTHSGIWCVSRTLWRIPLSDIRMKTPPHLKTDNQTCPIPRFLCYKHRMKRILTTLCLTFAVLLGGAGMTFGKEKTISNCSIKDRKYAKFWDNYYDPEDAYDFGRKIKQLVKEKVYEDLFALVEGELASGPRKQFIKGKKLSDIFSNDWRNDLLTSDPPCSPVGWRGFMPFFGKGERRTLSANINVLPNG